VSVHQVGFNFNLYKMHSEYNIKYIPVMFQVHIQPMPGPILGHIDEQKPLILVPSTDLGLQKNGADSQVLKF
jgi:hypothetical protein